VRLPGRKACELRKCNDDVMKCEPAKSLLVLTIASLALAGCAITSGDTIAPDGTVTTTMIVTTGSGPAGAGNEALLKGELTITDGCVTINTSSVPVFPNTASWDGTTLNWEGGRYVLGDTIALSGGQADVAGDLPDGCTSLTAFYVSGTAG
jgi:hypothetical protein